MARICNNCHFQVGNDYDICPQCGTVLENNSIEYECQLLPGRTLKGRYIIGNVVGYGGFGITYAAMDNLMNTPVAIKEYYPFGLVDRDFYSGGIRLYRESDRNDFMKGLDRFLGEARELAKFNHNSNIVSVLDFFTENDTAYMVMEFLNGQTLDEYIKMNGGTLKEPMLTQTIFSVCEALEIVHNAGVIHRDISPDNIFICADMTIKIIDFGAAKQFFATESKTVSVVLKHGFAPPEQYVSKGKFGPWTDIYALGATLYKSVTGTMPVESVGRIVDDGLVPPSEINPDIPKSLSDAIMKAMAIKAPDRYQNIAEFRDALLSMVDEESNRNVKEEVKEDVKEKIIEEKKETIKENKPEKEVSKPIVEEKRKPDITSEPKNAEKEVKKEKPKESYSYKDKEKEKYIEEMKKQDEVDKKAARGSFIKLLAVFALIIIAVIVILSITKNKYYTMDELRLRIENDSKYSSIGIVDYDAFDVERVIFFGNGAKVKTPKDEKVEIVDDGIYIKFKLNKRMSPDENKNIQFNVVLEKLNDNDQYSPMGYGNIFIESAVYELDDGSKYDFVNGINGYCLVDIGDLEPGRYRMEIESLMPKGNAMIQKNAEIQFTVKY